MSGGEWTRYWRAGDRPLEAMHARFERHSYHRHSHETYSFGVTEEGQQTFRCRGAAHTSAAGMVMAFNPDDPHDGGPADRIGFVYRIVHLGPELVGDVLADITGRPAGLPLFASPVVEDPLLAGNLRALHRALVGDASRLRRDELLTATVASMVRRAAVHSGRVSAPALAPGDARVVERARERLHDGFLDDLSADELARQAGCSRFALYRAFRRAYGMAPSDYQRQLRLRAARRLIAHGDPIAGVAATTGFADQSHLTRWFVRCYGITPAAYRRAAR